MLNGLTTTSVLLQAIAASQDGTWLNNPVITEFFWTAMLETILMTVWSTFFAVLLGLPLGLILVATAPGGLYHHLKIARVTNQLLGFIVNVGRSLPFVILLIAILPFTRWLIGTSLGWKAAVVPLSIAAIPFFARLVESNIQGVGFGKIEAAKMAGATSSQIMWGIQVREALPALIQSITVTTIALIGYSAMAGPLGADGLGKLALNYGYAQFQGDVMLVTVVGVLVLVMIVQATGDMLSRLVDHR
ncbi:MAG: methionine ABC transporter permease [Actinomycetaceae bacterium]|nr:methionine ABC transporter permease [Actinomycetaceae bacterium]